MRVLLWITGLLAALYSGYWVVGKRAMEQAAEGFFVSAPSQGLMAENAGLSVQGFPSRFDLTVTSPRLGDPRRGAQWEAPFFQLLSLSYKPWHVIAVFPETQVLHTPMESITITSGKLQASVVADPTPSLALDRATVVGTTLAATSSLGWTVSADELRLATRADPTRLNAHEIGVEVKGLAPDPALMTLITDLPLVIDVIHLEALATFSAPLDRNAAETQPQITALSVGSGIVTWGTLRTAAEGDLAFFDGVPEGRIEIRVTGWRGLSSAMVGFGMIKPEVAPTVTRMMEALATSGGDPEVLSLPLVFANGRMSLGPLPLGPAPRLN